MTKWRCLCFNHAFVHTVQPVRPASVSRMSDIQMPLNKPLDKVQDTDDVIKCMAVFADSKALCFRARFSFGQVQMSTHTVKWPPTL